MIKFIRSLGKKVQTLFKKIFGKKNKEPQSSSTSNWTNIGSTDIRLGAGEVFLDGMSLGKVESITLISKEDIPDETQESLKSIFGDGEINCGWVEIPSKPEIQKNFFNIPLTLLPKRYPCKALILSLAANQPYDYQAVDMSQYEERKLAHFILGRTCSVEEMMEEYLEEVKNNVSPEEMEEEQEWLNGIMEQALASGMYSTFIGEATLLHYEAWDVWDFEDQEED